MEYFLAFLIIGFLIYSASDVLLLFEKPINWILRKFNGEVKSGPEQLLGKFATVLNDFALDEQTNFLFGRVKIGAEIWNAKTKDSSQTIKKNDTVVINSVVGITLIVTKA